jgi:RecA/RadA recombinase
VYNSYLKGIDELNGGGYEEKEVYALYGEPNVGKTTFLIGEAVSLMENGVRVIWVDTEGGWQGVWNAWFSKYEKRFGSSIKLDNMFTYKRVLSVEEFCKYFGFGVSVSYDKNKIGVTLAGELKGHDLDGSAYEKFGRVKGKLAIIVDSFTSPIKLQFSTSVQNFSGRADAESSMLYTLLRFMEKTNAFTIITNHESKNPTDIYHSNASMRGGNTLKYYSKHIFYFSRPMKKAWRDFRKVVAVRTPIAPEWEKFVWTHIDENGYHDSDEQALEDAENNVK